MVPICLGLQIGDMQSAMVPNATVIGPAGSGLGGSRVESQPSTAETLDHGASSQFRTRTH